MSIGNLTSSAAYTSDGNRLASTTDAVGNVTAYQYNADTNVLEWVKYPNDTDSTRTNYSYDSMYRLASTTANTGTQALSATYTYTNDLLTKVQTPTTAYAFSYGNFGLRSSISVGSRVLASYSYTAQDNYLQKLDYGNGDSVQYTYDEMGRVLSETYENGDRVTYQYDNNGALATVESGGNKTTYYYDFTDRLMKYVESGNQYHSVSYEYDDINNLTQLKQVFNVGTTVQSLEYDLDNRVTAVTNDATSRTYAYDDFSRVTQRVSKYNRSTVLTNSIAYRMVNSKATGQIATFSNSTTGGYSASYSYTYDANGNILSVSDGTNTTSYVYDAANQLVRENNVEEYKTWTYTYDAAGNILTKSTYAYTTGALGTPLDTVNYTYGDSQWGDLLTAYDGQTITYDAIGNPLSDGTWDYTWEHGRQLASMTSVSTTWSYEYDANGLRTKRTNGTKTYGYYYTGDQLTVMTRTGGSSMWFYYDASGTPYALYYEGAYYYYMTNAQGDVVAIVDSNGNPKVYYQYDAWGNELYCTGSMSSTLGNDNPLRYRGYVYDEETGLYYLQSRYYNPQLGRFLNADALAATGQGLLGNNMFAYCLNNPVMNMDPDGYIAISTLILIGSAILGAVATGVTAYVEYQAGVDPIYIVGDSICAGMSAFLLVYSCGMSIYQCYLNYCYLNALTPVTNIGTPSPQAQFATVPQEAKDTLSYIDDHNGSPPNGYKGGSSFANDGRNGSQVLPSAGTPYKEYDIYPKIPNVPRGTERIVVGSDGSAWYTNDHYATFLKMR